MHEAKIASLILEKAALKAAQQSANCDVNEIELAVGSFRNVDAESLLFAFNSLKDEYPNFATANLKIQIIEASALCYSNGHLYHVDLHKNVTCPICGSGIGTLESGQELEIRRIKLEARELKNA